MESNNQNLKSQNPHILKVQNVSTGYGKKQVLFDVSLQIKKEETILLVGSNGSGKSTLLKAIFGIIPLWNGEISFNGEVLHRYPKLKTQSSKLITKNLMYIPQKDELFEDMTVLENLEMSILHLQNKQEQKQRLTDILEQIPILKNKSQQLANRLSGGERKMVSLAMALLNQPKLLLFDEPFAGLSEENTFLVLEYLQKIKQNGTTFVIIEHRIKKLLKFANQVIGLKLGQLHTNNLETLDNIKRFLI